MYIIKIESGEYRGKRFYLYTNKNNILKYGDLIEIDGEYIIPSKARNYKGFDYREYLKTKKIYGSIKTENNQIRIIERNKLNPILMFSNKVRSYIVDASNELVSQRTSGLLAGILLGDKSGISEETIENFKISNLSHMLSVSGAHASYIILGITFVLSKSKVSKKWIYILTIFILILFMFITNFTASVTRACFMAIIVLGANLLYRKPDIWTSISIALLAILIANPFTVNEIGLQLSFLGTIGIILFNKNIEKFLNRIKINSKISKLLSVTISAQIMIMPVMAYKFNTISLTFFISNILASPFLGINIILGFITIFISFILFDLAKILAVVLDFGLKILIFISEFTAKLPLSSILIKTPYAFIIILIYCLVLTLNYIYSIYNLNRSLRLFQKHLLKKLNKRNIENVLAISICVMIIFNFFSFTYSLISKDLKIYFIDVGQGDSCLIITPNNKKILIDGGEGEPEVLLSYLLDRRIKAIDYIMISHFDSDHCNGLIDIIENLQVKNILISKQAYFCDEYKNIANIINSKKIKVIFVKQGDSSNVDKNIKLDIFYPTEKLEYEDLNNNSIVAKLTYNSFSVLFTGDIEKSEENILDRYKGNELKSDVIKIAHHGSKTSSSKEFLKSVKPKIALIGVGENNTFGHPNNGVIERLESINCRIYRTDEMGEIEIRVNKQGRILVKKHV
ncbi:MAG: DNA internalization-related competence protein ComEC/Rec2 [Clostridia bacterium]|nr:DNA internalization-related competence protein ComEC/Rec2 [Clostridia bacterium]